MYVHKTFIAAFLIKLQFPKSMGLQDRGTLQVLCLSLCLNGLMVKFYMEVVLRFLCTVEFYSLFPVELCVSVSVSLLLSCLSVSLSLTMFWEWMPSIQSRVMRSLYTCSRIPASLPRWAVCLCICLSLSLYLSVCLSLSLSLSCSVLGWMPSR